MDFESMDKGLDMGCMLGTDVPVIPILVFDINTCLVDHTIMVELNALFI
jgi:hypothetical protein